MAAPTLFNDVTWVWFAFEMLSETRSIGFSGPLRINLADINAYCSLKDIRGDEADDFVRMIRALDRVWTSNWYEEDRKRKEAEKREADAKKKIRRG